MKPEIQRYQDIKEFSIAAAELVAESANQAVERHGHFTLALSGGSTPRTLYECLVQEPYRSRIPWAETHLFWGDERYVPVEHTDSNAAMVSQALIERAPIPLQNVHRISTELASPERVAGQYEATLQEYFYVFDPISSRKQCPVFDLILLGMGPDGHTASLFPDSPVLDEEEHWVAATPVPKLQPAVRRITLTFPVINAAKTVVFLVSGREKRSIMQAILDNPEQARDQYPSARVNPDGRLVWFVV